MQDLEPNDVMILDTFDEIFVWVGEGANQTEKKKSLDLAMVTSTTASEQFIGCELLQKYVSSEMGGHRKLDETAMYVVKQGFEPCNFTGHFPSWDVTFWSVSGMEGTER